MKTREEQSQEVCGKSRRGLCERPREYPKRMEENQERRLKLRGQRIAGNGAKAKRTGVQERLGLLIRNSNYNREVS